MEVKMPYIRQLGSGFIIIEVVLGGSFLILLGDLKLAIILGTIFAVGDISNRYDALSQTFEPDFKSLLFGNLESFGAVVKLRNGIRPLMIFGIKQTNLETNEEYDYIGVLYPEGNMGDKTQFLFNHEDIEEVISKGYTDETWEDFIKRMREFYKEI